jgi:hypothetical protein
MRSLLEKAIVHLLNGDQGKAEALFHKFMVERAREIHESLRQNDDAQLNEGWDTEIQEEEYFDDLDKPEADGGGDDLADVEDGAGGMDDVVDDAGMDSGMDAGEDDLAAGEDDLAGGEDDLAGGEGDLEAGEGDLASKLDHIESQMDELSAQFDELMAKYDDAPTDDFGADDMGGDDLGDDQLGDEFSDDSGDDMSDMGDESVGDDSDDLAGRMEDDMADDDQPEHEMAEDISDDASDDDEMMEDITESVLAELDRVAAVSNTEGKEIGSGGRTVSASRGPLLPSHGVKDRVDQAKPFLVKAQGDSHNDSFERETPPTNKKVTSRRNNDAGVKKLTKVPAKGDAGALINSDFAAKPSTKPIIDGSKKVR